MRVSLAIYDELFTIDTDMRASDKKFIPVVAAVMLIFSTWAVGAPVLAQSGAQSAARTGSRTAAQARELDSLFIQLKQPIDGDWRTVERKILAIWSESGSAAMNLLLARGRKAIADKDYPAAIEHLSALIDHAPDFAEGWNARATAFFLMGQYGPAVRDIRQTLRLEPRHFGALAGLGMILEEVDRPADALKAYRAALAIHPWRPDVIEAIKRLRLKIGDTTL